MHPQTLSRIWVERAAQFVTEELSHLADGAASHAAALHAPARLALPDHSRFHQRAEALAPLLQARAHLLCTVSSASVCWARSWSAQSLTPGGTSQSLQAVSNQWGPRE